MKLKIHRLLVLAATSLVCAVVSSGSLVSAQEADDFQTAF